MNIEVFADKRALGRTAAERASTILREAIAARDRARIVAATGAAQFEFLEALTSSPGIDWQKVEMFHLDEYVGLPITHPASFRRFLHERLIAPTGLGRYHLLHGDGDVAQVMRAAATAIATAPIDVAFVGIGENTHLAFNDPPADFETDEPFIVVALDQACRQQQVGEGWFDSLDQVPTHAISMSVRQILKSVEILCIVPDRRKARAVQACLTGEITPLAPASALRRHPRTTLYLDRASAELLDPALI